MTKDWIHHTNIYEVNLRQYTKEGSFQAFAAHLPRLKEMGVQTLWFMPVTPISKKEMKGSMGSYYACSDYVSVNPEFGTLEHFKSLVDDAHHHGFKVIIDWVANHTGWDHVWTVQHPEWYEKDEVTGDFKKASGMDDIIELDYRNAEMRKAMTEAMKFWVKQCDIDGFRCDLAFWVEPEFWMEAIPEVNQLKPLFWLAEMEPSEHSDYMQVFDAAYAWSWMHKTEEWYRHQLPVEELIKMLAKYQKVPGLKAWFTSNHDENSWNGSEYEKYGEAALPLAVHSCTWPGIPLIYSGQEIPNKKRLEFFDKDPIEWNGNYELEAFYHKLLSLKQHAPALHAHAEVYRLHTTADSNVFSYLRKKENSEVLVMLNLSSHLVRFDLKDSWVQGSFRELFTGIENDFSVHKNFEMEGWAYRVYQR